MREAGQIQTLRADIDEALAAGQTAKACSLASRLWRQQPGLAQASSNRRFVKITLDTPCPVN
jgi:hypothetical protein